MIMIRSTAGLWRMSLAVLALVLAPASGRAATAIAPTHGSQVLETLAAPTVRIQSAVATAVTPPDMATRAAQVRAEIGLARQTGDNRHWGRAQALLAPWWDRPAAPIDMLVLQATVQQGRHAFDAARAVLREAVARAPDHAQAWLALAALERLRADYPATLRACDAVARAGAIHYAAACRLESLSLQGRHDAAATGLRALIESSQTAEQRSWLLSLLAEALERAGQEAQAEQAFRDSLGAAPDLYTGIALSDLLLRTGRAAAALAVLQPLAETDAVLLRRSVAMRRLGDPGWTADRAMLTSRAAELVRRGDDPDLHGREAALTALWLDDDPAQALRLARRNLQLQREPVDWWVALASASQAGDTEAWTELQRQRSTLGLRDKRLERILPPSGTAAARP